MLQRYLVIDMMSMSGSLSIDAALVASTLVARAKSIAHPR
jgi:hypothetical protein